MILDAIVDFSLWGTGVLSRKCLEVLRECQGEWYHLKNLGLKVHPLVGCHERGKLT